MNSVTDYTKILPTGKVNATKSKELALMLGFDNVRALQTDIAKSREAGQVILSSASGGYYLPANKAEIEEFIAVLKSRAINTFKAMKSARRALEEAEEKEAGQICIDDIVEAYERILKETREAHNES